MAHENATPRPWASWGKPSREFGHADIERWSLMGGKRPIIDGYVLNEEDAALIVEAVNAYDTLRAENERLTSKVDDLEADLHDEETRVRHYRELYEDLRTALKRAQYALTKSSFSEAEAVSEAKRIVGAALSEAQP